MMAQLGNSNNNYYSDTVSVTSIQAGVSLHFYSELSVQLTLNQPDVPKISPSVWAGNPL
ncbi:MAG: hypothetical protein ACLPV8_24560 [Steroidobacteraceae bacterium]